MNMSTMSHQVVSGRSSIQPSGNNQLEQSVRKSLNASVIMSIHQQASSPADSRLSKEQQIEIATKIKHDYKKLNEFQATTKLAQEVISMPGQLDEELVTSFWT